MVVATRVKSPVTTYAEDVLAGRIVAGPYVRLACERHLRDLDLGPARGLNFNEDKANRVFTFFEKFLLLSEGEHAGKPFILQPWQKFILGSLFGWEGADGYRRFRKFYGEIGKGAGKSPLAAGIGLYGLIADDEPGAEIYAAAVTRDQAGIMFTDAKRMVAASPYLQQRIDEGVNNLAYLSQNSFFRPVSSEARSLDGKRVHMALIDEVHEHRTPMVIQKMQAGTKGRRQPLIVEITNSGWDQTSICWQHHQYSVNVLEQVTDDDGWFAYVCALDKNDDWTDPSVWIKGNPNLGVSVTQRYLEEQVREAQAMPAQQNIVKRLNFCIWTEQAERWIDMSQWDACAGEPDVQFGDECFVGLDFASTVDLSAAVAAFPRNDGTYDVLCRFWRPEDTVIEAEKRDGVPYRLWAEQGYLELTPGTMMSDADIADDLLDWSAGWNVREYPYDRFNASGAAGRIQLAGGTVVTMNQGPEGMSAPCHLLEGLLASGKLRHGGHPILRWMASQMMVKYGANDSIRPWKPHGSGIRNDGIVALLMALGRASVHQDQGESGTKAPNVFIPGVNFNV